MLKFLFPFVILAGAFWGYMQVRSSGAEAVPVPVETKSAVPLVSADTVELVRAVPNMRLYGAVETPDFGLLTSAVEANVIEVHALEGDRVEKGELLVRLDDADILLRQLQHKAELQEVDAQIESDRIRHEMDKDALEAEENLLMLIGRSVERAQKLVKSQAGAQSALDAALQDEQRQRLTIIQRQRSINEFPSRQQQLKARKAKIMAVLKQTERDLEYTRVIAPFDGRITDMMVVGGDRVVRGGQLLRLYNESALELRVQVPSSVVQTLQRSIEAGARITGRAVHHGQAIPVELNRLSALVEQGRGGIDTFFRATNGALPTLGTILEVVVNLPAIPDAVVLSPDTLYDQDRVYVIDDDRLVVRKARFLGTHSFENGEHQVILDGQDFAQGELIMSTRLPQAVGGMRVQVETR